MYKEVFEQLGLYKNEARIYESLLKEGEMSVGSIATKSQVHRRNVYDTLNRLMDKGLVFEITQRNENRYSAVDPNKLAELIQEKEQILANVMPDLQKIYKGSPHKNEVYTYRGPEGWKNYMRDMLRLADDVYFIGAKGGWLDKRVKEFLPRFLKEAGEKKIRFHHLFDHEVEEQCPEILAKIKKDYKFLPKGYSTNGSIEIFADRVYLVSGIVIGGLKEDFSLTVIVNQEIADAFKSWFKLIWDLCPGKKY